MDRGEDGQRRGPNGRSRSGGRPPGHRLPVRSLAGKLQLTRLALGCSTQKELVARFAAVNPATAFTAQNAYKWLGGKAMPRVSSVYEDWAQILGGRLAAPFIAACSFEEFALALREHFDIPDAAVRALRNDTNGGADDTAALPPPTAAGRVDGNGSGIPAQLAAFVRPDVGRIGLLLEGSYLVASLAWSRAQSGRVILGAARIDVRDGEGLVIDYFERVLGHTVPFAGPLIADSQAVQSVLECLPTGRLYFLALQFPVFPANVIGGLLCGTVLHDPEIRSVASRIVLIRNHALDWDALVAHCSYADLDAERLTMELAALGYAGEGLEKAAGYVASFLRPPSGEATEVGTSDMTTLGGALDLLAIEPS